MKRIVIVLVTLAIGCSNAPPERTPARPGMMGRGMGSMPMMMGAATSDSAVAPQAAAASAPAAGECPPIDQSLVTAGRSVFSGAGNCYACHAANAKGTALAPDLTDGRWLDTDGSYASIAALVRSGVPHPKAHPGPMPARGGSTISDRQVCAVSAYVYSLGHH